MFNFNYYWLLPRLPEYNHSPDTRRERVLVEILLAGRLRVGQPRRGRSVFAIPENYLFPVHADAVRAEHVFFDVDDSPRANVTRGVEFRELGHVTERLEEFHRLFLIHISA